MARRRTAKLSAGGALALTGVALAVSACGGTSSGSNNNGNNNGGSSGAGSSYSSKSSSGGSTNPYKSTSPSGKQPAAAGAAEVATAKGPAGTYLTGPSGKALYLWVADHGGTSSCSGTCAEAWPPLTTKGAPKAGAGVNAGELSTIARSDGTRQVVYNGHPLYYYIGDSSPGTTAGEGSNGFGARWWLVSPAGAAITTAGSASSEGAQYSGSGGAGAKSSTGGKAGGGWS